MMQHRRRRTDQREDEIKLQIAPMIDVVFLLLIFFIFATKFPKQEGKLESKLPTKETQLQERKPDDPPTIVVVDITREGKLIVNGQAMSADQLAAKLAQMVELWPTQPVIITGDPMTRHRYIVVALDACHRARIKNVSFGF